MLMLDDPWMKEDIFYVKNGWKDKEVPSEPMLKCNIY